MRVNDLIKKIDSEIKLFSKYPKEYLYIFTYSSKKKAVVKKFSPESQKIGLALVKKIKKSLPKIKTHFVGSLDLGIDGLNDIDIFLESRKAEFNLYLPKLIKLFGGPKKIRNSFIEWEFEQNGVKTEIILTDKFDKNYQIQLNTHWILKTNKKILSDYEALKKELNGATLRNYYRKRFIFFSNILENNKINEH